MQLNQNMVLEQLYLRETKIVLSNLPAWFPMVRTLLMSSSNLIHGCHLAVQKALDTGANSHGKESWSL